MSMKPRVESNYFDDKQDGSVGLVMLRLKDYLVEQKDDKGLELLTKMAINRLFLKEEDSLDHPETYVSMVNLMEADPSNDFKKYITNPLRYSMGHIPTKFRPLFEIIETDSPFKRP